MIFYVEIGYYFHIAKSIHVGYSIPLLYLNYIIPASLSFVAALLICYFAYSF